MPSRRARLAIAAAISLSALVACTPRAGQPAAAPSNSAPSAGAAAAGRPNIVFVLTDDLSTNLVPYMPNVRALQRDGTTFSNFTVTNSLCCPSRASLLTGRFPHNTGIIKNHGKNGGFRLFHARGEEKSTFATDAQAAGYRTAFLGKYLNEYQPGHKLGTGRPYVPPGWDEWYAGGDAYRNFNYALNENHRVVRYGDKPADYLTDVIAAKARDFITVSAAAGAPFLVELSAYAPHSPFTPAPRDAASFPGLTAPRGPAFDKIPTAAPAWLAGHAPLTARKKTAIDVAFRKRVQAVQAVDRMIGTLRETLEKSGVADRTIVIFNSDNGFHLGEHRLSEGKQTAFDTDITVPLVVAGPGVRAGQVVTGMVQNIDLRPTFAELTGAPAAADIDGRSIVPLLAGATAAGPALTDPALAGPAVSGSAPAGSASAGPAVPGSAPAGPTVSGSAPAGSAPAGPVVSGPVVSGPALAGSAPASSAPADPALAGWRELALVEHLDSTNDPADPDFGEVHADLPPTYQALRATGYKYVEYVDGSREYYDLVRDPNELHNTVATLPKARLAALHAALRSMTACRGQTCWTASWTS